MPGFWSTRVKGIKWDEQPLGKVTDCSLALALGVSKTTVARARTHRGIAIHARPALATSLGANKSASPALLECVERALGYYPKGFCALLPVVRNDFGSVASRTVRRALTILRLQGRARATPAPDTNGYVYRQGAR